MKASTSGLSIKQLEKGVLAGDRIILAKALTLIESTLGPERRKAQQVLNHLLATKNKSIRVGITGVPGAGKSTFIEALGRFLTQHGKPVAVLAVDPTSQKTKGSILGDKTRMDELSKDPRAFIRPTPAGNSIGGIASATYEAIALCEAAGFEVIIIETVGVGQSEVAVRGLVDFFLLLMLPGAGDELQGIKKGIMEMADGIVITKADGDNQKRAKQAQADLAHALHLFQASESGWSPKVILSSALEGKGISDTWHMIEAYVTATEANGYFQQNRNEQRLSWFRHSLMQQLREQMFSSKKMSARIKSAESAVRALKITPAQAADDIIRDLF